MKPETEKALRESIAHWERNVSGETNQLGREDCALCLRFGPDCVRFDGERCPVHIKTGLDGCQNTPYAGAHHHYEYSHKVRRPFYQAELDFLKSLLPKPSVDWTKPVVFRGDKKVQVFGTNGLSEECPVVVWVEGMTGPWCVSLNDDSFSNVKEEPKTVTLEGFANVDFEGDVMVFALESSAREWTAPEDRYTVVPAKVTYTIPEKS